MRGGGDWLPLLGLMIGFLLLVKAWHTVKPWIRKWRQRAGTGKAGNSGYNGAGGFPAPPVPSDN